MQKIVVILGPTATGKSDLAVKIARKFNGEIISADSRQVYRGLNIGTGKITRKEMRGVPHHLLDVADPKKQFTASDFVREGREKIAAIFSRGHLPIICGGTGFYISALLGEISLSEIPPNLALRKKLTKKSANKLFAILQKLNPDRAADIDRHNPRRLIRAIEIAKHAEHTRNERGTYAKSKPKWKLIKIGLNLSPARLKRRISIRLFSRISRGMIAEAKRLHKNGLSWQRMDELGLEYRYLALFLQNKITRPEMLEKLNTEIWRYSKRQITWFKRDKKIKWFAPTSLKQIEKSARLFLKS